MRSAASNTNPKRGAKRVRVMAYVLPHLFSFVVGLLVLQALVIGTTELYRYWRGKGTIIYYNIPFPVDGSSFAPGDSVRFGADVAVADLATERSTYVVTPELHRVGCESVYQLSTFTTASTEHTQTVHYTILIPRDAPAGRYEVRGVSRWSNDSASGGVAWKTVEFDVTGTEDKAHDPCG